MTASAKLRFRKRESTLEKRDRSSHSDDHWADEEFDKRDRLNVLEDPLQSMNVVAQSKVKARTYQAYTVYLRARQA